MSVLRLVISELSSQNTEQNMIHGTKETEEKLYTYQGKTFYCKPSIIQRLNLALAYNRAKERYEEVKPNTTRKG